MGTPPFIYANRALASHGIDPSREVTWKVFPPAELGLAMQKGEVDAIADSEPIGTMLTLPEVGNSALWRTRLLTSPQSRRILLRGAGKREVHRQ